MLVIFVFSHREPILDEVAGKYRFDGIDKVAHFFEYTLLFITLYRSFFIDGHEEPARKALLLGIFFAMSDEIHQGLLPYRQCQVGDFLADSLGLVASYVVKERLMGKVNRE